MKKAFKFLGLTVLILIVVAAAYLYVNRAKLANLMIEKSLPQVESLILKELPASVSKEQVHEDFTKLAAKFQAGHIDSAEVKKIALEFKNALRDEKLDSTEAKELLDHLHRLSQ
ncbi:MAG: hypothetical protein BWY83_00801 [bacterium ADurb.Bin478]|nr:MAG: hypothetical protein BWY83_00801 [bacterium ADurb.Bin478]